MSEKDELRKPEAALAIKAATAKLLLFCTPAELDLDEVAREAGLSRVELDGMYATKTDLLADAAARSAGELADAVNAEVAQARDGSEAVRRYVRSHVGHLSRHYDEFRMIYVHRLLWPSLRGRSEAQARLCQHP